MAELPNPTPPGGGSTYGQTDFAGSAQRSKAREKRAEETPTRAADKAKETTKAKPKPETGGDIARPYRDTGAL